MRDHRWKSPQVRPPRPGPAAPAVQHRELYPFASHWLDVAGHRLHYLDEGPGLDPNVDQAAERQGQSSTRAVSTLVLLHGNPSLLLPEAGHFVPEDASAAMAEAMLAWLGSRQRQASI